MASETLKKIEIGVLVTLVLAFVSFAFWLGILSNRISNLESSSEYELLRERETDKFKSELESVYRAYDLEKLNSVLPLGTIVAYGGANASPPKGWFPCDGRVLQVKEYPDLYRILKNSFGGEADTYFNLPDLRGRFLRGVDHNKGVDLGAASREASAPGGNTGDQVGSIQSYATAKPRSAFTADSDGKHSHKYNDVFYMETDGKVKVGSRRGDKHGDNDNYGFQFGRVTAESSEHNHSVTGGDSETRPVNINVEWIIKVE